jgi:hypothetical protein
MAAPTLAARVERVRRGRESGLSAAHRPCAKTSPQVLRADQNGRFGEYGSALPAIRFNVIEH